MWWYMRPFRVITYNQSSGHETWEWAQASKEENTARLAGILCVRLHKTPINPQRLLCHGQSRSPRNTALSAGLVTNRGIRLPGDQGWNHTTGSPKHGSDMCSSFLGRGNAEHEAQSRPVVTILLLRTLAVPRRWMWVGREALQSWQPWALAAEAWWVDKHIPKPRELEAAAPGFIGQCFRLWELRANARCSDLNYQSPRNINWQKHSKVWLWGWFLL